MDTLRFAERRGERGQAIIEMALTLPLLLLVVLGVFDFGFMFQRFEVVTNAAREGARTGVLPDYCPTPPFTACPRARARAQDYLSVGGLGSTAGVTARSGACGGSLQPNTSCISVVGSTTTIAGPLGPTPVNEVTVTVEYDHQHVFVGPIMTLFGGSVGTARLRGVSRMRME